MKKNLLSLIIGIMLVISMVAFTSCGSSDSGDSTEATQTEEQATQAEDQDVEEEETVNAADPMTDEELEKDDSGGCIEDSDDLLY